jgi:ABC-type cobalamin/Fe3+-siderophores transport system ATPase subunit
VEVDGRDAASFQRREFARAVSFMPQIRSVPDIDVYALVCHGRFPHLGLSRHMTAADREAVELAMERTGVSAWRERNLRELSGGERQRVYIAMALCQESGNLLLDEPSAWLDAPRQFELLELFKSLAAEGKTVVMVLHELAQAMPTPTRSLSCPAASCGRLCRRRSSLPPVSPRRSSAWLCAGPRTERITCGQGIDFRRM